MIYTKVFTFFRCSSYDEPGEVKAFFVLRFRAVGKFLGKLIDKLGAGNVSAAGEISQLELSCIINNTSI